jgi:uncharacterized protein (TIGR02611 family)
MGGKQSPTEPSAARSADGGEDSPAGGAPPSSAVEGENSGTALGVSHSPAPSSEDSSAATPSGRGDSRPPSYPRSAPFLRPASWRARLASTLEVIRANPTGRFALRVSVAAAGLVVVAVGLALIPLPGPGWLLVILGLSIWAIEFVWAKHLLQFTRRNVQAWTHWAGRQSWPIRIGIGLVGLIFVSVVIWLSLKFSFGIDVAATVWNYVTTH